MPVPAALLVASLFVSGSQPAAPAPAPAAPALAQQQSQDDPGTPSTPTEKPHEVGLGGFGGSGGGPSFRYFFTDQVGIDLTGGWYRPMTANQSGTSFQISPSMVVMLNKSHQLADLDVRPYVGAGLLYLNGPTGAITQTNSATVIRESGLGMQAFGGVEFTFAAAPSIAISAETIYHKLPVQTYNVDLTRGFDFYVLFHYYMK
jgi:hypothetical protein